MQNAYKFEKKKTEKTIIYFENLYYAHTLITMCKDEPLYQKRCGRIGKVKKFRKDVEVYGITSELIIYVRIPQLWIVKTKERLNKEIKIKTEKVKSNYCLSQVKNSGFFSIIMVRNKQQRRQSGLSKAVGGIVMEYQECSQLQRMTKTWKKHTEELMLPPSTITLN